MFTKHVIKHSRYIWTIWDMIGRTGRTENVCVGERDIDWAWLGLAWLWIYSFPNAIRLESNNTYSSRSFNLFNWVFKCIAFQLFGPFSIYSLCSTIFLTCSLPCIHLLICACAHILCRWSNTFWKWPKTHWMLLNDELQMPMPTIAWILNISNLYISTLKRAKDQFAYIRMGANTPNHSTISQ